MGKTALRPTGERKRPALRIAAIYAGFGASWILFSDKMALMISSSPEALTEISIIKGLVYVLLTALLLYNLVGRSIRDLQSSREAYLRAKEDWEKTFDAVPDLIAILDNNCRIVRANKAMAARLGLKPEECTGLKCYQAVHGASEPPPYCPHRQLLADGIEHATEVQIDRLEGYFSVSVSPLVDPKGEIIGIVHVARDITDRKRAEEALAESEKRHRLMSETIEDVFWMATPEVERMIYVSPAYEKVWGRSQESLYESPKSFIDAIHPEDRDRALAVMDMSRSRGRSWSVTFRVVRPDGSIRWVEDRGFPVLDDQGRVYLITGVAADITERKRSEEDQRAALKEKEVLLREIHHRVKNNMQVISSLLSLQAEKVENEQVRQALLASQQRIVSMAMIHETLYSGKNLATIDLAAYLKSLVNHLQGVYGGQAGVRIALDLDEVDLSIDQVVPCGLIINELITNSFKHAFPEGRGMIRVKAGMAGGKEVVLEVSDNGVGLAEDTDLANTSSLGLRLVHGLLKHQLKGSIEAVINGGTAFTLRFPVAREDEAIS